MEVSQFGVQCNLYEEIECDLDETIIVDGDVDSKIAENLNMLNKSAMFVNLEDEDYKLVEAGVQTSVYEGNSIET